MPPSGNKEFYFSSIASTGQLSLQAPQETHLSWSMTYLSSPMSIASEGHPAAHVPQDTQSSLIKNAMIIPPISV